MKLKTVEESQTGSKLSVNNYLGGGGANMYKILPYYFQRTKNESRKSRFSTACQRLNYIAKG
jgi:hypothetical protein